MVDRFLSKYGVGFALLFMVAELSYINTKSLQFMVRNEAVSSIDLAFGIVGALAFSTVTVLIMRLGKRRWLKNAFPVFDTLLMFLGFNLMYADRLLDNPVRFGLSVFLSLFTGLITYSLGQINADQHAESASDRDQKRIDELIASKHQVELKLSESERINSELISNQNESKRIIDELTASNNDLNSKLTETKTIVSELLPNHILWENFLGQKRKDKNGYENAVEILAKRVKSGAKITINDYNKLKNGANIPSNSEKHSTAEAQA